MKYFILQTHDTYKDYPHIKNWHGKIDSKNLNIQNEFKIKERQLLFLEERERTVFTGIITKPFPLILDTVKDVFDRYVPGILYKKVILLDQKHELSELYYLPILKEVDCMAEESQLNRDKSFLKKLVINYEKTENQPLFRLGGVNHYYMVARFDLVESLLKRGIKGIGLQEAAVIGGRDITVVEELGIEGRK